MQEAMAPAIVVDNERHFGSRFFRSQIKPKLLARTDRLQYASFPYPVYFKSQLFGRAVIPRKDEPASPVGICLERSGNVLGTWDLHPDGRLVPITGKWSASVAKPDESACAEFLRARTDELDPYLRPVWPGSSVTLQDAMDRRTHPLINPVVQLPLQRDVLPQRLLQSLRPYNFPRDLVESAAHRTFNSIVQDLLVKPDTADAPGTSARTFSVSGKQQDPLRQDFGTYVFTYGVAPDATGAFKPYRMPPVVCVQARDRGQLKIVDVFKVVSDKVIYEGVPADGEVLAEEGRTEYPPTLETMPPERWTPLVKDLADPSGEPCKDLLKVVGQNVLKQRSQRK